MLLICSAQSSPPPPTLLSYQDTDASTESQANHFNKLHAHCFTGDGARLWATFILSVEYMRHQANPSYACTIWVPDTDRNEPELSIVYILDTLYNTAVHVCTNTAILPYSNNSPSLNKPITHPLTHSNNCLKLAPSVISTIRTDVVILYTDVQLTFAPAQPTNKHQVFVIPA